MLISSSYLQISRAREEISVFVERYSHHSVGRVEGLFYSVAVVHIDVHIEHPVDDECLKWSRELIKTHLLWYLSSSRMPSTMSFV